MGLNIPLEVVDRKDFVWMLSFKITENILKVMVHLKGVCKQIKGSESEVS